MSTSTSTSALVARPTPLLMPATRADVLPAQGGRRLHLLDLENLLDGQVSAARVRTLWQIYTDTFDLGPSDIVVAACAEKRAGEVLFALPPSVRVVLGHDGPDGADQALMDAIDAPHQAARFDQVIIGSRDHAFVPMATQFVAGGCPVTLFAPRRFLSAALRMVASTRITLSLDVLPWCTPIPHGRSYEGHTVIHAS